MNKQLTADGNGIGFMELFCSVVAERFETSFDVGHLDLGDEWDESLMSSSKSGQAEASVLQ